MKPSDEQLESQVKSVLEAWAAGGPLPDDRLNALLRPVRRYRRARSRLIALTAAVASLLLLLAVPPVRVWAINTASRLPLIGQFIRKIAAYDPMWNWAEKHDAFQTVMAEATDQGYTVRLHQVLADPTQTTVIFTIEGEQPLTNSHDLHNLGVMLLADGRRLSSVSSIRPELVDGTLVVALETGPLQTDEATLTLDLYRILHTEGRWRLEARVSRTALTDRTRTITIDRDWQLGDLTLHVHRVVISPAQTVVELSGPGTGFDIFRGGLLPVLMADGKPLEQRNQLGTGTPGTMHYRLLFAPVTTDAESLTLQFSGYLMQVARRTAVPLEPGSTVQTEGGWELRVETYSRAPGGEAAVTLSYPHTPQDPWRPYENWSWIDQGGAQHPITPTLVCASTDPRCRLQFSVPSPQGAVLKSLQADAAWIKVEGPWEMQLR